MNKNKKKRNKIPNEWITHFEKSNFLESPIYKDSITFFKRFTEKTSFEKMFTLGISPQGRDIKYLVAAKGNEFTPSEARKSGKAIVLIQNGIHPGEIEGKDSSMLLLREILITKEKEHLLDNLILLIIPVFNVDGHERLSQFNRPNQKGPKKMGWRTNALNLNLNRDYMKADTPEIKAWLKLFNEWLPDFMIDNHTTNGADYQYHITYGIEKHANIHFKLSNFIRENFLPNILIKVEEDGFLTAPYVEFKSNNLKEGLIDYPAMPRLSNGYCALQNRICLLVETHSLKPFKNRVFSTLSMNYHSLNLINQNYKELIELNSKADKDTINRFYNDKRPFPINFKRSGIPSVFNFKGFESFEEESKVTASKVMRYSDKPVEFKIPFHNKVKVIGSVIIPSAYLIPKEFRYIVEILRLHNIEINEIISSKKMRVEKYRLKDAAFEKEPYEGRMLAEFKEELFWEEAEISKGTFIVPTNQRTLRIIVNLLEPSAPDSFVKWGFFNSFFERKEYAEAYIMEPIAKKMIEEDQKIREEFFNKLNEDESFRNNPDARLDFFYRRSVYFDWKENVYPVMRMKD